MISPAFSIFMIGLFIGFMLAVIQFVNQLRQSEGKLGFKEPIFASFIVAALIGLAVLAVTLFSDGRTFASQEVVVLPLMLFVAFSVQAMAGRILGWGMQRLINRF